MRTCGSCTLCCKVMAITALKKPMNKWCEFCDKGAGCKIYPSRPSECQTFDCLWLKDETFPDEFKPQRSRIVFTVEHGGRRLSAHVDAAFPGAWQEKKLYALLKRMSAFQAQKNSQLCLYRQEGHRDSARQGCRSRRRQSRRQHHLLREEPHDRTHRGHGQRRRVDRALTADEHRGRTTNRGDCRLTAPLPGFHFLSAVVRASPTATRA